MIESVNPAVHPADAGLSSPWLVADIGGSNARFAWVPQAGSQPLHVRTLAVAEYPDLLDAVRAYLGGLQHAGLVAHGAQPRRAAFAMATAVGGDRIEFTNSSWAFSRRSMAAQLGLGAERLLVLNDFEALALSLPRLRPAQWQLQPGQSSPDFSVPVAVVGPGTGLGVAGLVPVPGRHGGWQALAGEGGHATLAPHDDFESQLLAAAREEYPHVSAERFLSGIGLPVLYRATAKVLGQRPLADADGKWIVERAMAEDDPLAGATIDRFCAMLGGFCGSVALMLGARGGVFIGGGIVPRLGARFAASEFRARFEAKGRFSDYVRGIPTPLITDTLVALDGAAQALAQAE
jgi:glucokinase